MGKTIIGILPTSDLFKDDYYEDTYGFVNLYSKRIFESDGIAIGILMDDGNVNYDILDLCDGFLIPGGHKINKYVYEILFYALRKNKPVLGICLGAQAISILSLIIDKLEGKVFTINEILKTYNELKGEFNNSILNELPKPHMHYKEKLTKNNIESDSHLVRITKDSILYNIYNTLELNVISLHNYAIKKVGKSFKINAIAEDNVIEGLEYNNPNYYIIGVQFHPEISNDNKIFERLIIEAKKRK